MTRFFDGLMSRVRPLYHEGGRFHWAWPLFEFPETFLLWTSDKTTSGAHVRDPVDLKRLMMIVIYALVPATLMGMWNVGYQGYLAEGVLDASIVDCMLRGAWHMLPLIAVSYGVGGMAELVFCIVRKHEVAEGFLVTGLLYPLTLPPSIPLWMAAMGIVFGVVIGKEVFGGTGMNVLNPALTARAFVFFTYPAVISGAKVWDVAGKSPAFLSSADAHVVDGYSGATPLLAVSSADRGADAVAALHSAGFDWMEMFLGSIPGSMGEVSALAALIGAVVLIVVGVASWRIMAGCVVGLVGTVAIFNAVAGPENVAFMTLPPHYHLVMGGFAFGAVFMATDPVSAATTQTGRWLYGIGIGALVAVVRVVNPAYPEGVMLAILFMNVFAPLIDYFVLQRTTRRRVARLAAAA